MRINFICKHIFLHRIMFIVTVNSVLLYIKYNSLLSFFISVLVISEADMNKFVSLFIKMLCPE